jgi:hypothetical protein
MQLNNFIQAYIPASLRTGRDFTGTRGWVNLTNLVLKRYESYGWFKLDRKKETGVEVSNSYWIDIPSDMRLALNIYAPPTTDYQQMDRYYKWQIVNGKLKLKTPFDKAASPDSFTLSGWSDTSVYIDDDDAEDSEYHDHLLVITNGDLSGRNIVVADNDASVGGTSLLTFYHDQSSSSSTSTAGYLTTQFLMLEYMAVYTGLSSQTDEIPIDNRFEYVLAQSLIVEAMSKTDKTFPTQYQLERQMIEDVNSDEFSLPAGTRIRPRRMPGYEECPGRKDDFEYIGDGYDN